VSRLSNVAVVGASLAGLRAVETLRRKGFEGRLTLIGAEAHLPYDRPPLSKDVLRGETEADALGLRRAPATYEELDLDLRLGRRALSLDVDRRTLALDDGATVTFDGLLVATGASVRTLPGQPALEGRGSSRCGPSTTPWPCAPRCRSGRLAWSWWAPGSSAPRWRRRAEPAASR
jgi:NADPH-dependent 2,4-dienoyl-CoA reductase/sulfur reductase-like enzyme